MALYLVSVWRRTTSLSISFSLFVFCLFSLNFPHPVASYLVVILFHKAAQCQSKALVWPYAPVHGVHRPWRLVFIDFFSFAVKRHPPRTAANPIALANYWTNWAKGKTIAAIVNKISRLQYALWRCTLDSTKFGLKWDFAPLYSTKSSIASLWSTDLSISTWYK